MEDGDCAVLFDRRSRQTHVLSPAARRALALLIEGPLTAAELQRGLAPDAPAQDPDPDLATALLGTFDALGLVEPANL